jgi:glycosyltransferase involved in cell wall biosynthesis
MKVLYVIPLNKIGGAESAFNSVINLNYKNIEIIKYDLNLYSNNPILFFKAFFKLYRIISDNNIKFVISTLYKSHLVVFLVSFFLKIQIVPFIVGIKFFSILDKWISLVVIRNAKYILVDSKKGEIRLKEMNPDAQIFSFLIHTPLKIPKLKNFEDEEVMLTFIFVGRLNRIKRLDKAFEFLNLLHSHKNKKIQFDLYGPIEKGFDLKYFLEKYNYLNINYRGIMSDNDRSILYPTYNFYLQLSDSEGSGMSIIEAMRFGLIPVITNVGEVANSCKSGVNSIVFGTDSLSKDMVNYFIKVLESITIQKLSINAFETFKNVILFNDILLEILNDIYDGEND